MPPKVFAAIVLCLAAVAVLVLWQPWGTDAGRAVVTGADPAVADPDQAAAELGYYPPAPSTAVGMTEEWREFADQVDRICAVTYNNMIALEARVAQVAAVRGWPDRRVEAARIQLSANQGAQILAATKKLGEPPERPELFARWRANVARRASLKARASLAAADGRWYHRAHLMNRVYPLKDRSDEIGQSFGLRICTSN